ncbi:MAG TPA: beta-ketoacyl-ACP synthase III [Candidatus Limnocylindrales bacterium]|nr:beta-ketoacyl-ACP synthase III [Candidatus Limnocylindrales bacterium]
MSRPGRARPASVRVSGWGMYAPERRLTNADLERVVDTSDEWIVQRTGIRERRVAAAHETTATLAAIAGKRAIAVAGLRPDDIDVILVGTLTPDYWMPSTGALVKEAIGNTRASAMDVMAACSGFVYAYSAADAYLRSGMFRHALVIGAETLSRFLDFSDRSTCILFGDGAGAVVLSASEEEGGGLQGIEMTTDPDGAYMIWLPSGGARSPVSGQTLARGEHFVRMEGKETYRYATKTLAASALKAIERAGWEPDEIDLFIPHQANIRIIESVAKGLDLPMEKMFVNVDRYGNTSAASVGIALAEAVDFGRIKVGDKIVLVAFGAGLTSGAIALEWTTDPAAGARAAGVEPVASVREPVDWSSVDPIPDRLRQVLEHGGGPPVPLDDVVPGEPQPASPRESVP